MPLVKVVILINQKVPSLILYAANRGLSLKKEGTENRSVYLYMHMLFIFNNTFECVKYVLQIAIFLANYKML
jgi:hypothetical protein